MRRLFWGLYFASAPVLVLGLLSCSSSQALPDPPATEQRVSGRDGWYISVPERPTSLQRPVAAWVMADRVGELTLEVRTVDRLVMPITIPVSADRVGKWIMVGILGDQYELTPGLYVVQLLDTQGKVLADAQIEAIP